MDQNEKNDITDDEDKDDDGGGALMSYIYRSLDW